MIQYLKKNYVQNLNRLWRDRKNYIIFRLYNSDVSTMTSSTQNQFF